MEFNQEDAHNLLVRWLRKPDHGGYSVYGYGVYLPALVRAALDQAGTRDPFKQEDALKEMMAPLYAAAWDLCRRGILRPGVKEYGAQATDDGSGGNGYTVTPFGRQWLEESDRDDFVPTEPGRFAQMLAPYQHRFGPAFKERSQEAIRCYGAHAYLACCSMCGAAAESILLASAIAKSNADTVLAAYNSTGGRGRTEKLLLGDAPRGLQKEFSAYMVLLKYWRDQASHGGVSGITDNEAYTSLALLLRLALFVDDRWTDITGQGSGAATQAAKP